MNPNILKILTNDCISFYDENAVFAQHTDEYIEDCKQSGESDTSIATDIQHEYELFKNQTP